YPQYLYYSPIKQVHLHAVEIQQISKYHQPKTRLKQLMEVEELDNVEADLVKLCHLFKSEGFNPDEIGVTGSILIAAQNQRSDIDLVFYTREKFNQARKIAQQLINQGKCSALSDDAWLDSYDRRACELSYSEYIWHEKRKFNKALINQRKFDLSFVIENPQSSALTQYKKIKSVVFKAQVSDDTSGFDYPAQFLIDHQSIHSIVCYTATYTGQAQTGEWVEVSGQLEQSSDGVQRVVVGSSREAIGEYIKVVT
ncbi:MAG: hypothetical protein KAT04_11060, partial [Methylococcales bacterium]|nr:hypothetical protein [Methylococcales bacterium]